MIFKYYLGLGSNIEPRIQYLKNAVSELSKSGKVLLKSSLYESEAWGNKNQNKFLNAVIRFQTELNPFNLLKVIISIEIKVGRKETGILWAPREIDIDIIFADGISISHPKLKIPHEYFHTRKFVLIPMAELNNDYMVEGKEFNISNYVSNCKDKSAINNLKSNW